MPAKRFVPETKTEKLVAGRPKKLPDVPLAFHLLAWLRTPLVMFIVVPISFVIGLIEKFRNWYFFNFKAAPHLHDERVKDVQRQVRAWNDAGRKKRLCTARSPAAGMNVRMPDFKDACNKIDISSMRDILHVDEENATVRLEPLVNMGYASRVLVPKGFALQVLPEMDDLTIGGLVCGHGVSTQSHLHGTMKKTIVSIEMVLADGTFVHCTADNEYSDLFRAVPWSHGTLGIMVACTVKLVRVKPYVRMRYIPCYEMEEVRDRLLALARSENPPDMLEATVFSPSTGVIQAGYFDDGKVMDVPLNKACAFYKPWFCKHVEATLDDGEEKVELLPLRDYYHRHSKAIFWEFEDMVPFGNHWLYRYFWAWMGPPKVSLVKATQGQAIRQTVLYKHACQEFMFPVQDLAEVAAQYSVNYQTYPILLYVLKEYKLPEVKRGDRSLGQGFVRAPKPHQLEEGKDYSFFCEFGAYGVPFAVRRGLYWDAVANIRKTEKYIREIGGHACLCFDTLQSEEEFMEMYDHRLWLEMRKKYKCEDAFPKIFTKVRPEKAMGLFWQWTDDVPVQ